MIKRLVCLLAFLVGLTMSASAQNAHAKCTKLSEPSIGLSFYVPPNWKIEKQADETYQQIFGETYNSLTPVMGIHIIVNEDKLSTVFAAKVKGLTEIKRYRRIASVKLESKSKFKAGNLDGYKAVFSTTSTLGFDGRAIFYFFKGKDKGTNIVFSALIPLPMNGDTEKVIDDAVKTLEIAK